MPRATALDRYGLQKAGFTHVLNAAHGRWNVDTGPDYYSDMAIEYHGVEADDLPTFDLSVFFYPAAAFIDAALSHDHSKRPVTLGGPTPTNPPEAPPRPHEAPPLTLAGGGICALLKPVLRRLCVIKLGMSEAQEHKNHTEHAAGGVRALTASVGNRDREGSEERPLA